MKNIFFFNSVGFFEQLNCLPMGVPSITLLTNCFVENIETIALDPYFFKRKFWRRYMDDIISVWNYGEEELRSFLVYINFLEGDLRFKME